jgi:hypothetical protein
MTVENDNEIHQHTKFSSTTNSSAHQIQQHNKFSSTPNSAAHQIQQHTKFSGTTNSAAQQIQQHTKLPRKTIQQHVPTVTAVLLTTDILPAPCETV